MTTIYKPKTRINVRSMIKQKGKNYSTAVRMIEEDPDKTFYEIAQMAGVQVSKVYEINAALESEKELQSQIQFEAEKAERLSKQMDDSKLRREAYMRKEVERLFYEEGWSRKEIGIFMRIHYTDVANIINSIQRTKGGNHIDKQK